MKAPPLTGEWVNCAPVPHDAWLGRVTILVFWTASCEASLTQLRRLEALRSRFGERPLVIAVHSPRLRFEQNLGVVEQAIRRNRIDLPVIHDIDLEVWGRYGIDGRPSTVVIDHRRRVVGGVRGLESPNMLTETVELADQLAAAAIERSGARPSEVAPPSLPRQVEAATRPEWSSIAVLGSGDVVVVDAARDRLVGLSLDPSGTGADWGGEIPGLDGIGRICGLDGDRIAASFPAEGRVEVIDVVSAEREVIVDDLVRPQGLTLDRDGSLVVADAAGEQLVRICSDGLSGAIAGSGFTGVADGRGVRADLAQPVAVQRVDRGLLFSEAGSSALRILTDDGAVLTITANEKHEARIIEPGLIDGPAAQARLCRPLDLAALGDGRVVIADTANDRLRILEDRKVRTIPLAGLSGPEAVAALPDGRLLVADTGNSRLVLIDLDCGVSEQVAIRRPVEIAPEPDDDPRSPSVLASAGSSTPIGFTAVGAGPWTISVRSEPSWLLARAVTVRRSDPSELITLPFAGTGEGELIVDVSGVDSETKSTRHHVSVLAD